MRIRQKARKTASVLLGVGAMLALGISVAPHASAASTELKNFHITKCVTPYGGHTANGTNLTQWSYTGHAAQFWNLA
ncbi:RICIN domain-containing protein [Actinacidiphila alni]|uniref:RICIN domain-containing protein n=1 Tax=Actinacidiphila alni TaxID=380248 RepID=UPI0034559ED6